MGSFHRLKRKSKLFGLFLILLPVIDCLSSCVYFDNPYSNYRNCIMPGEYFTQEKNIV